MVSVLANILRLPCTLIHTQSLRLGPREEMIEQVRSYQACDTLNKLYIKET
jgi:hypothetical protein